MVGRLAARVVIALLAAGCMALGSCGTPDPEKANYLRVVVAVDQNLKVPDEIDSFKLTVQRESVTLFTEDYTQEDIAKLPDSLIIDNPHPSNDSPDQQVFSVKPITIKLVGYAKSTPRIWRYARVQYNAGKRQIGLPLCKDCLDHACPDGETCILGTCSSWSLAPADSDEGPMVNPLNECGP
ncbi:MAG: hypothetical protein HY898_09220 [Deltaproteobacteria bacterium]|nr:hypothetical protein [Deltaproteobacteria bacterium]